MATLGVPSLTDRLGAHPTGALVYELASALRVHLLRRDLIRLGRGRRADISLADVTVSRCHALVLTRPDGAIEVIDESSLSGTRVNGVAVQRRRLDHGDVIRFGRTDVRYVQLGP